VPDRSTEHRRKYAVLTLEQTVGLTFQGDFLDGFANLSLMTGYKS
jgi:hypothetical protein